MTPTVNIRGMIMDIRGWFRHILNARKRNSSASASKPISPIDLTSGADKFGMSADLFQSILSIRSDEIGCDECFAELDRYAELIRAGEDAAEVLPLVHDHLHRCPDCYEEYEVLLIALRRG